MKWCQRHLAVPRSIGRGKCRRRVWSNDNVCYKVLHEAGRFWKMSALIVCTTTARRIVPDRQLATIKFPKPVSRVRCPTARSRPEPVIHHVPF